MLQRMLQMVTLLALATIASAVQFLTQPQLHLTRRLMRKSNCRQLVNRRDSRAQHIHHACHHLGGFAGTRGSLHKKTFA